MTGGVVEVGPAWVCGQFEASPELICAAIEHVDDELGLLDDQVVSVRDVWNELMRTVIGGDEDAVVLVCPTWWSTARIDLVRTAAHTVVPDVSVHARGPLLADHATRDGTVVVEIAAELIVVVGPGPVTVVPILGGVAAVVDNVCCAVGRPTAVLIDAPAREGGAARLGEAIAGQLRGMGIAVSWADTDAALRAATSVQSREAVCAERPLPSHGLPAAAVAAGVVTAVAVVAGLAAMGDGQPAGTRLLVEGRISVEVPTDWPVRRITSGPGSARLQLVSPSNEQVALHLTQSIAASGVDLVATGESLRAALAAESSDVFIDFNPSDVRVGRPAVTYREVRGDRQVAWTVLADGRVRIAIGCQSPAARVDLVHQVCDRAVDSARATRSDSAEPNRRRPRRNRHSQQKGHP
ncbi:type VII secretion-associated protein [Mycobacterium sp. IDR2000157661]|uniref:type VII secretion-associated protein n=1 Tax=Mycobacterium sp. IDR2000157661 TaxID=2867005 RepID=UPI001EEA95A5|nr:type VII secretion-associated protein [Mycobacterium sp. IDR2000157661]ULE33786.1 type VII secretion-associated protein [Mycobacterium sp. IDR2000157661]